ncbi:MAG: beta-ketoacyl-ACP synthase II [Clostridia bacterium]
MHQKRVAVTGLGVITSIGETVEEFWENIRNGVSGIRKVTRFEVDPFITTLAAEVRNFEPEKYIARKDARRMDRYCQFALAASINAVQASGLDMDNINKERTGVLIGAGIGGMETLEQQHRILIEKGHERISPFFVPMMISNMASGMVSIHFGAKGICECVTTACSSGTNAIGNAFRAIQRGDADIMICGGSEAAITPLAFAGFCAMRAMSANPDDKTACRPFDRERDGFIMGEGAGILVIEEYEHAMKRGARIIAEIAGYGTTSDAFHMTAPAENGEGGARAMALAIADAGLVAGDVDYINAHGTSTPLNDVNETKAIKTVFREHAYQVKVSSTKSMTGHLLGAAGGVEGVICCLAIQNDFIPPTIHLKNPDPECDLDYVPGRGVNQEVNVTLSNSFGFGGHNAAIILKKAVD